MYLGTSPTSVTSAPKLEWGQWESPQYFGQAGGGQYKRCPPLNESSGFPSQIIFGIFANSLYKD